MWALLTLASKLLPAASPMGRPPHWVYVVCFFSFIFYFMDIYWCSLYIPYIFHTYIYIYICIVYIYIYIHIYVLNISLIFSFVFSSVCFAICSVNSRSGHDRSQTFGSSLHVSGPKQIFWGNFIMVLHGFASRNSKKHIKIIETILIMTNMFLDPQNRNDY